MAEFTLPYGTGTMKCTIPDTEVVDVLTSRIQTYEPTADPQTLVLKAMANPIGSPRLKDLAKGKKKVVLIASDHTRPVPSKIIVPPMLREIREGNPDAEITILIATGCHRGTRVDELRDKFGDEIMENEHIVVHDCDTEEVTDFGKLPSGGPLVVNSLAAEADLIVAEGFIEPHFFAGFSGGRKSILPGIAGRKVVLANHNGAFIADPKARTGNLEGNPVHRDMIYAAKTAGLKYIVNTVLDADHKTIYAVAGDLEEAHEAGCRFLAEHCGVVPSKAVDVVVTTNGGYPMDQNVYQAVKGMTAAEMAVRPGGVIIMCSKCEDGHGGPVFYDTFRTGEDLQAMMDRFVATPADETIVDQWQSQIFVRVLLKATVIFVSEVEDRMVRDFRMIPAPSVEAALEKAKEILGKEDITVTVIPDGIGVMVEPPAE